MRVLKARFRTTNAFLEAYSAESPNGDLFCATTHELDPQAAVVVEVHFPGLPNKLMLRGTVISWRPALPRLRVRAGAVVRFEPSEAERRDFLVEAANGCAPDAIKRRHSRLPIDVEVHWRRANSAQCEAAKLRDISMGGAQLLTSAALVVDEEIVVELVAPGGAQAIHIAGRITNSTQDGFGVCFVYRDGGGSRRLKEVMRRLISA